MATEKVVAPIWNSHSSDDEILGVPTHVCRKSGRAGWTRGARDSGTDEQLDLDFGGADSESGKRTVRGRETPERDDLMADVNGTSETPTSNHEPASWHEVFEGGPEIVRGLCHSAAV